MGVRLVSSPGFSGVGNQRFVVASSAFCCVFINWLMYLCVSSGLVVSIRLSVVGSTGCRDLHSSGVGIWSVPSSVPDLMV